MNCSRVRKWLLLYAGGDLAARKARRLERHLEGCADCRREHDELKAALAGIRAVAERDTLDWPEGEWKGLMSRVRSEKPASRPVFPLGAIPRKAWAYGFAIVLAAGIVVLVMKGLLSPPPAPLLSEVLAATPAQPSRSIAADRAGSGIYPRDIPFRVLREQRALDGALVAAGPAPEKAAQNMMSLTLVSQETGLKVHWTFNRNFEWEEKKR